MSSNAGPEITATPTRRTGRPGGRRVLFVNPPSVVQEQMIHFLVTAQYEAAIVKDHRKINAVLRAFPDSVVYFNIDSHLPPAALEQIVRAVINGKEQHGAEVGILSYNANPEMAKHYLMDLGATCGYVILELGFQKSARIVMKALEAVEARGDRRFVRVRVPKGKGTLHATAGSGTVTGEVLDISEAGMACLLKTDFGPGTILPDIQLRLWGSIVSVGGTIRGTRSSPEGTVSVVMFDKIDDSRTRSKLYTFLRRVMQYEVDNLL
ncbi:MAG: PilZ domain-containing protein [Alkalispirochaeta sp.]